MASLWRLQTNTDGGKIADFCLKRNVLAMGWSLQDAHLGERQNKEEIVTRRNNIKTFDDYLSIVEEYQIYSRIDNIHRLYNNVKTDDLVWIRYQGCYYLGRITENSRWVYAADETSLCLDAANQISCVEWYLVGDESTVPGAIATSLIRGSTLQHIWKSGTLEFSQLLYNRLSGQLHYKNVVLRDDEATFFSLLSPDDCEDLLCMWLFDQFGYICIPSTNKKSTELYECVLIDPQNGNHIYPQVKAGKVDLDTKDYEHLDGEVWLFTTKGAVTGIKENGHVKVANPTVLYEFAKEKRAALILPSGIVKWRALLSES